MDKVMEKGMDTVIKVILSIIGALLLFLFGWFGHAWKSCGEVPTKIKKALSDVNKEHAKAIKAIKKDYEGKLKEKDEIIANLKAIIERLLVFLGTVEGPGVDRLVGNLKKNNEKLHNL